MLVSDKGYRRCYAPVSADEASATSLAILCVLDLSEKGAYIFKARSRKDTRVGLAWLCPSKPRSLRSRSSWESASVFELAMTSIGGCDVVASSADKIVRKLGMYGERK